MDVTALSAGGLGPSPTSLRRSGVESEDLAEAAESLDDLVVALVRILSPHRGVSLSSVSTLARLEREGPIRLTALAAAEKVSQPSMTQLVQRLERQGLVSRIADFTDRRATLFALTPQGRTFLADHRRARQAHLAELIGSLSSAHQQQVVASMGVMRPAIEAMFDPRLPRGGAAEP